MEVVTNIPMEQLNEIHGLPDNFDMIGGILRIHIDVEDTSNNSGFTFKVDGTLTIIYDDNEDDTLNNHVKLEMMEWGIDGDNETDVYRKNILPEVSDIDFHQKTFTLWLNRIG